MDEIHPHLTVRISFSFLLLIGLQMSAEAQGPCFVDGPQYITENNKVGDVVATITVSAGETVHFREPVDANNPFRLVNNQLIAERVFDYESQGSYTAMMTCTSNSGSTSNFNIIVIVNNVNDNRPTFEPDPYDVDVREMSPVGTSVIRIEATDLDQDTLYYTLTPASSGFRLSSSTNPLILVETPLEYDKVKSVQLTLHVQDTPLTGSITPSFSSSTTVMVTIIDVDNRPPWFQPCTKYDIADAVICQSYGYTGTVIINEQETGALSLKPGPLGAIDGDNGINEEITYKILNGNDAGLFEINPNTGSISMLKAATEIQTITLTILAAQKTNTHQFATTTVTVTVQPRSFHPPKFQRSQYEAIITAKGEMAMDLNHKALQIIATDDDYSATGGLNPYIIYYVEGRTDFAIVNGYLFMTEDSPEATLSLQLVAIDTSSSINEKTTSELTVEVRPGLTTSVPPSTAASTAATDIGETTTNSKTTENIATGTSTESSISTAIPSTTSETIISTNSKTTENIAPTTNPSTSTESGKPTAAPSTTSEIIISTSQLTTNGKTTEHIAATTNPSTSTETGKPSVAPSATSEIIISTSQLTTNSKTISTTVPCEIPSTAQPHTAGYSAADMAALGATLGVLLFICLVVIVVLSLQIRRGKADWRKIYETSMFLNSLTPGSGGQKDGIQYTNDAFQKDEDEDGTGSDGPDGGSIMAGGQPGKAVGRTVLYEEIVKSSAPLHALLRDDTSQTGSDKSDSEKEVKPILTKERRMDDGYKSVWFKEDIDPNAKEEVLIIPDNRENDSEEDDDEQPSSSKEDEDDNLPMRTPRVVFVESDLDSGVGVKLDSKNEDVMSIDL